MNSVTHKNDVDGEAHALRRYVSARAAGRPASEYSRADHGLGCWLASDVAEAAGRCDGKNFRQIRRPSLHWCPWLGLDTRISKDHALQTFFELHALEQHDWQRLLKEVSRNRRKALQNWRSKGREIIRRVCITTSPAMPPAGLAEEFRLSGKGMRSLKTG